MHVATCDFKSTSLMALLVSQNALAVESAVENFQPLPVKSWFFTIITACLLLVILFRRRRFPKGTPPGTPGWPIIGETLHFSWCQRKGTVHELLNEKIRKHGRVFTLNFLGKPTVIFCGPEGNRLVFSNENKLVAMSWPDSVKKILDNALINTTGDHAKRTRKLLMTFLKPEALRNYLHKVDFAAKSHLERFWLGKEQVYAFPLVKKFTFALACSLFISVDNDEEQEDLSEPYFDLVKGMLAIQLDLPGTRFHRGKRSRQMLLAKFEKILKERKEALRKGEASPSQDLLSLLLTHVDDEDGKGMPENEIKDNILTLIFAGHDTSNSVITTMIKLLAEYPHFYEQILQEQMEIARSKKEGEPLQWEDLQKMKYTWRAAQETLRLYPPVQSGFRKVIKEFTYEGYRIPEGWKVMWTTNGTHRQEEFFKDAMKFDPSRFEGQGAAPYTFVPFGGGPRTCIGMDFARMEILVFMHHLVRLMRWQLILPSEQLAADPIFAPAWGLPLKPIPHIHG